MRILHISTRLIIGGAQENTILTCRGHVEDTDARSAHEAHLAFGPIYGPEGSMLPDVLAFNETHAHHPIRTHELPSMVRQIAPIRDTKAYHEVKRLIREIDPDVVHTHTSKAGVLGRFAAWHEGGKRGRRAVVHTIHGKPFHVGESAARNAVYIAAERACAERCHAIISVADAMTEAYLARGIGTPDLYATVRSGMEMETFTARTDPGERADARRALGIADDACVIGTLARLAEFKGHRDILRALGPVLEERADVRLLWVGDGWLRGELEHEIEQMGLGGRVVITGMVAPAEVPRLLGCMDVLVHGSYQEGLPRAVPQALLRGVAVVATDADGTREVVEDGLTGRLVGVGDVEGIRDGVRWMMADGARAARTAAVGRARCVQMFDWRAMVEGIERVYDAALARARGG